MIRYAWTTFHIEKNNNWDLLSEDITEEKIADWAVHYPHVIFFIVTVSTDIS